MAIFLLHKRTLCSRTVHVFPQIYESGPDEMNEKILCSIEKQALVQVIIKELAEQLVPENYRAASCVSANFSY